MGYTPSLVVAPLRQHPDITEMHVFYSGDKTAKRVSSLETLRQVTETFRVRLHEHTIPDGFDYDTAMRAFVDAYERLPEHGVLFNASSGPRPMIMAAALFCHTHAVPLVYYDEYDTKEGRHIPLHAYRSLRGISDTKRTLLKRLQTKGPCDVGTLARHMRLATSTISEHVKELSADGVLIVDRDGRRRVVRLSPAVSDLKLEAIA